MTWPKHKRGRKARAAARELTLEMGTVDTAVYGWRDQELAALDKVLAELEREPGIDTGSATRQLLGIAYQLRRDIARADSPERDRLIDRYAATMHALNDASSE